MMDIVRNCIGKVMITTEGNYLDIYRQGQRLRIFNKSMLENDLISLLKINTVVTVAGNAVASNAVVSIQVNVSDCATYEAGTFLYQNQPIILKAKINEVAFSVEPYYTWGLILYTASASSLYGMNTLVDFGSASDFLPAAIGNLTIKVKSSESSNIQPISNLAVKFVVNNKSLSAQNISFKLTNIELLAETKSSRCYIISADEYQLISDESMNIINLDLNCKDFDVKRLD